MIEVHCTSLTMKCRCAMRRNQQTRPSLYSPSSFDRSRQNSHIDSRLYAQVTLRITRLQSSIPAGTAFARARRSLLNLFSRYHGAIWSPRFLALEQLGMLYNLRPLASFVDFAVVEQPRLPSFAGPIALAAGLLTVTIFSTPIWTTNFYLIRANSADVELKLGLWGACTRLRVSLCT